MTEEERQDFLYLFFPFLFGVYPYTVVTDKQRRAMDEARISYRKQTVYEIVYGETRKLLVCKEKTREVSEWNIEFIPEQKTRSV